MKKKIIFTLAILVLVFGAATCLKTQAGTGENGAGWLWGGGTENDGASPWDGTNTNIRWISMNNTNTGGAVSYGVNIPAADCVDPNCNVTGNAWSGGDDSGPGLGYINFDPAGPYPNLPNNSVIRNGDYLEGWARFEEIRIAAGNSGGWSGWIKMRGTATNGSPYGVEVSKMDGTGNNPTYAWSEELGWIDFSKASIIAPKTITASISATPSIVSDSATPVSIAANVTGGTATGDMVYELDCDNSGTFTDGKFPASGTTGDLSHEFANACTYSATSTVAVRITRDGVSVTPTASVIFGCIDNYCDTNFQCKTQLKDSGCNAICDTTTCKAPQNANWKEVAP